MSLTDPVSDFLTRVRNAINARQQKVDVPHSKLKVEIARILKEEGYIANFKATEEEGRKVLRVYLKYSPDNASPISRPEAGVAPRLPGLCGAWRDPARAGRVGNQYSDHSKGRDDWSPGAQRRRRRRSSVRDLLSSGQPSARQPSMKARSAAADPQGRFDSDSFGLRRRGVRSSFR